MAKPNLLTHWARSGCRMATTVLRWRGGIDGAAGLLAEDVDRTVEVEISGGDGGDGREEEVV